MNKKYKRSIKGILIDAREFFPGRLTGIGRVIEGLVDAISQSSVVNEITLAVNANHYVPSKFYNRSNIRFKILPGSFLKSEKFLSDLSNTGFDVFLSPYPKLPLFGCYCPTIHIIHDVLDLTHPAYKNRLKTYFDGYRLKKALKRTELTWYDSHWSLEETKKYAGFAGENPRVRHPGIDDIFNLVNFNNNNILHKYNLEPGYILVIGNGMPHKNPGVLLRAEPEISRNIVFAGASKEKQQYWKSKYPENKAAWIDHIEEDDLPVIIRKAFCLAQPSTAEGYGYPPLEAMACGVPAVISNIPVLTETSGRNALFADPNNPKDWIDAINSLEDKIFYEEQVVKGLKWVEPLRGQNGWRKHISDIEELLS